MHSPDPAKYYVFYDGDCGFCNGWVHWILKNDKKKQFLFAPLQSKFGQQFLRERNLNHKEFDTIYLWKPNSFYLIKSQAFKKIAGLIGGKYSALALLAITPQFLNDQIYDAVAKRRKSLPGNRCLIPTEEEKARFISD